MTREDPWVARAPFELCESLDPDGAHRLTVEGELDLSTGPVLEDRLRALAAADCRVRLDLSQLRFIDCTGVRVVTLAVRDSRRDGWELEIDCDVSRQVSCVIDILRMGTDLWPRPTT